MPRQNKTIQNQLTRSKKPIQDASNAQLPQSPGGGKQTNLLRIETHKFDDELNSMIGQNVSVLTDVALSLDVTH